MIKWLIKHSRFIFNNKGQFDPLGFQQEIQKQISGLRALALNQLKRKQALQDLFEKAKIEQQIAQQDPIAQFLQRGKVAGAIKSISDVGGDVSQFRGLFGGQPTQAIPTAQPIAPTGAGIQPITPTAGVEPVAPQLRPTTFERTPLGGIRATKFERIATQEELDKEAERDARAAGIKKQVLDKLKGLPGESAGKLTMIQQALRDLGDVEKLLFTEEGKGELIKGLAAAANVPAGRAFGIGRIIPDVSPFGGIETRTKARQINSKLNNALEAKLRIETGAAATQEEFDRLQTRFGITAFDTTASAKDKIKRLKEFMRGAIITIDPTGRFIYKTGDIKLDKELNAGAAQINTQLDAQINQLLDQLER